jgi:hypothetical protein
MKESCMLPLFMNLGEEDSDMARKKYSCDFETTTKEEDCRVWAYGWMEIGNKSNYKIGNSMDEFMAWVSKCQGNLYFHNLRFDGEFIVNWLLKNGFTYSNEPREKSFNTVISNMGQWYIIDICYGYKGKKKIHTIIYDSLKKLPFPVKKIAKDFNLLIQKGDIDYHLERPIGWEITPEEESYIKNDIEIVADALDIQFKQGLDKITAGSDSLAQYKAIISKKMFEKLFPVFTLELHDQFKKAYRGGFTWVNEKFQGKEVGAGMVFDVNSLYPSQMYSRELPWGNPIYYEGEYKKDDRYPLYIQCIECEFELKEGYIPTIQLKKNLLFKPNEYLKTSEGERVEMYVSNVDLELMRVHYNLIDVEYLGGWKFKSKVGLFKDFIDKWMYVKTHEKGAKKLLAKLILNSSYGKFGTSPNVTGKVPYLKEDGSTGFRMGEEEFKDPVYMPMAVFITSWARYTTISAAQSVYDRILYCDTDSIHILGTDIPDAIKDIIDDNILGYWKHESTFTRAKFLRQKTYIEEVDGHLDVKCAGMPEGIKKKVTFENFKVGFSSLGKLLPKHVDGGVVLVDTEFTIK